MRESKRKIAENQEEMTKFSCPSDSNSEEVSFTGPNSQSDHRQCQSCKGWYKLKGNGKMRTHNCKKPALAAKPRPKLNDQFNNVVSNRVEQYACGQHIMCNSGGGFCFDEALAQGLKVKADDVSGYARHMRVELVQLARKQPDYLLHFCNNRKSDVTLKDYTNDMNPGYDYDDYWSYMACNGTYAEDPLIWLAAVHHDVCIKFWVKCSASEGPHGVKGIKFNNMVQGPCPTTVINILHHPGSRGNGDGGHFEFISYLVQLPPPAQLTSEASEPSLTLELPFVPNTQVLNNSQLRSDRPFSNKGKSLQRWNITTPQSPPACPLSPVNANDVPPPLPHDYVNQTCHRKGLFGINESCVEIFIRIFTTLVNNVRCPTNGLKVRQCLLELPYVIPSERSSSDLFHFPADLDVLDPSAICNYVVEQCKQRDLDASAFNYDFSEPINLHTMDSSTKRSVSSEVMGGNLSKAASVLNRVVSGEQPTQLTNAFDSINSDIQDELRRLHPVANSDDNVTFDEVTLLKSRNFYFTIANIRTAMKSAKKGSSNGVSAWTFDLLKYLGIMADKLKLKIFWTSLTKLINLIFHGELLNDSDSWTQSFLILLKKPTGGLRPLAIGEVFIRLVARCSMLRTGKQLGKTLFPLQLGVGVSGGSEMASHIFAMWFMELESDEARDKVLLSLDLSNAFNTMRRKFVAEAITRLCPELSLFFQWSYSNSSPLLAADGSIVARSATGLRQGDPLGPLLFAIAFQPILDHLSDKYGIKCSIVSFLDDSFARLDSDIASAYVADFKDLCAAQGLSTNISKSRLLHPLGASVTSSNFLGCPHLVCGDEGLCIMGRPFGNDTYVHKILDKIVVKATSSARLLCQLDSNIAIPLLRYCINTKMGYYTRIIPDNTFAIHLTTFDSVIDSCLATIASFQGENTKCIMGDKQKLVRGLPQKLGGLGLNRCTDISPIAYIASSISSLWFGDNLHWSWITENGDTHGSDFVTSTRRYFPEFSFSTGTAPISQHDLSYTFLHTPTRQRMIDAMGSIISPSDRWFLNSESKSWMNSAVRGGVTIPCTNVDNRLNDFDFKCNLRLGLLLSAIPSSVNFGSEAVMCKCSNPVNLLVDTHHCLHCISYNHCHITLRHDALVDALGVLISNLLSFDNPQYDGVSMESRAGNNDRHQVRKCDLKAIIGQTVYTFDVTVVNTSKQSCIAKGNVLDLAEATKNRVYSALADFDIKHFFPVAFETCGNHGKSLTKFLEILKSFSIEHGGCDPDFVTSQCVTFFNTVSVIIARANGYCMSHSFSNYFSSFLSPN